jgi:hypothetical protein
MRSMIWCLLFVACGGEEPGRLVIDSPGEGPSNTAPLWVPRPGPLGPSWVHELPSFAMSEDRWVGGRRVFVAGQQNRLTFDSRISRAEPYAARFYGRHEDGIYLEGDSREGLYDPPILWVPKTVKVGMRWSHAPRWSFEVISREEGPPARWTIAVTDRERRFTNQTNTGTIRGAAYLETYVEGGPFGPYWQELGSDAWLTQDSVPPPADPPDVPELELTALNGGKPIAEGILPSYFGAVVARDEAGAERIDLSVGGRIPWLVNSGLTAAFFIEIDGGSCGRYAPASDSMIALDSSENACSDARSAVVDNAGRVLRIMSEGWSRHFHCVPAMGTGATFTCNPEKLGMLGIVRGDDGEATVFAADNSVWVLPHDGGDSAMGDGGAVRGANWKPVPGAPSATPALWLPREDGDGWSILTVATGGLLSMHLSRDGRAVGPIPFRDEGGNLGVASDANGRRVLRTHPDGAIERLTWDTTGIHIEPLARVMPKRDRLLVGAVELGDRLLLLTLHDFEGADTQYFPGGRDPAVRPALGELRLWSAPKPAGNLTPRAPGELTRFEAELDTASQSDVGMCRFSGEPSLDGWIARGTPALAYRTSNGCLTLVPDKARDDGVPGTVSGRLPALGAFTMRVPGGEGTSFGDDPFDGALPLAGGGYAVCTKYDGDTCVRWRVFDATWKIVAEDVGDPPAFLPLPDPTRCATEAGATCFVSGNALLDCRGPGAPGPLLLPNFGASSFGVPNIWRMKGCFSVEDTLWLHLHQNAHNGERALLWQVDTTDWTITPAAVDALRFSSNGLTPEGRPVLVMNDGSMLLTLRADGFERTRTFLAGGVAFRGPMLFGSYPDPEEDQALAQRRVWRPDVPQEPLASCGDGVLAHDERCRADWLCEPGPFVCEGEIRQRCNDRGDGYEQWDCSIVCNHATNTCNGSGEQCHDGACVKKVACGAGFCAPGEWCVGERCAVLPRCGDGLCESEEVGSTCADCVPDPWDGVCTFAELWMSGCGICGDGACNENEDESCPRDCVGCGDGVCSDGELEGCPMDCPGCGNGYCEPIEKLPELASYCALDCLPCEADRPGCFRNGVVTCDGTGAIVDYTLCEGACVDGACE